MCSCVCASFNICKPRLRECHVLRLRPRFHGTVEQPCNVEKRGSVLLVRVATKRTKSHRCSGRRRAHEHPSVTTVEAPLEVCTSAGLVLAACPAPSVS